MEFSWALIDGELQEVIVTLEMNDEFRLGLLLLFRELFNILLLKLETLEVFISRVLLELIELFVFRTLTEFIELFR